MLFKLVLWTRKSCRNWRYCKKQVVDCRKRDESCCNTKWCLFTFTLLVWISSTKISNLVFLKREIQNWVKHPLPSVSVRFIILQMLVLSAETNVLSALRHFISRCHQSSVVSQSTKSIGGRKETQQIIGWTDNDENENARTWREPHAYLW